MMDWRRIIVAIDKTPASENAVRYVGSIVGHLKDVQLCLLHIYPEPPPDYFRNDHSQNDYRVEKVKEAKFLFIKAEEILYSHGIRSSAITSRCIMADHKTISDAILEMQQKEKFGTIVVGKRGVSKAEEFLFGSISNALIHHGRNLAVWVVG